MAVLLVGWSGGDGSEEAAARDWLIVRLAVGSVAVLGLLIVLFVAVIHAFVDRFRQSLQE